MPRSQACSVVMSPSSIGPRPRAQASAKTGSITNEVRNSARVTISMFGGACCSPIPWRSSDSTVTMNGKQVTMIAIPGAKLRTVISRKSCTARPVTEVPSPRSMLIDCAAAAAGSSTAAVATAVATATAR